MGTGKSHDAAGPPTLIEASARRAHLETSEYEYCRNLMLQYVQSIDRNEIYTLGAVAVTIGFSLSSTNPAVAIGSAIVPPVLILLSYWRYRGIASMCHAITEFMLRREDGNPSIEWSSYQRSTQAGTELRVTRKRLWWALTVGCIAFLLFQIEVVAGGLRHHKPYQAEHEARK